MESVKEHEDALLEKLETKYARPMHVRCPVCDGEMKIAHKGGGLPLRWVCEAARIAVADGDETSAEHLEASTFLDYRRVGDARVVQLVRIYREMRRKLDVIRGEAHREHRLEAVDENS